MGAHIQKVLENILIMNATNPFGVVKANEFTIAQIIENWVPLVETGNDYFAPLKPQELMPKYVLGSKGCGKTHLLRYYSFEARLARHKNDIKELLKKDKYLASYSRLNSISSSRFNKNENAAEWQALYNYYFELIQSIISLEVYKCVTTALAVPDEIMSEVVSQICKQVGITVEKNSIDCLVEFLNERRVTVDKEIIEFPHVRKLNWDKVKPAFSFGTLLFEIPHSFSRYIEDLRDLTYIYILDEYEKLTCEWMKKSLNTLVYEKRYNATFWVGLRKIGYTTKQTMSGEPIHEGHEFDQVDLDALLKANEKGFSEFATQLFKKRLELDGLADIDPNDLFDTFDEMVLLKRLVQKSNGGASLKHWKIFRERLKSFGVEESSIMRMQQTLCNDVSQDLVDQKMKLYAFYLEWSKKKNEVTKETIQLIPGQINTQYEDYKQGNNEAMKELYRKFRQDMVAQLAEENNETLYLYSGFEKLVKIADCNPRVFLTLMKLIVEDCHFRGIDPFADKNTISVKSQYAGINETARWFLNDIEVHGKDREDLGFAMNHLLDFMHVSRFCDKPSETSLCSFYYRANIGQGNIDHIIELAQQEAFLMEVPNKRKDKTLGTPQKSYQVNRLIATMYNLPIARRGITSIPLDMLKAIFDPDYFDAFNSMLMAHRSGLNAPFGAKKKAVQEPSLFD